jgi:polar amino acid transport system substrate-binding protein
MKVSCLFIFTPLFMFILYNLCPIQTYAVDDVLIKLHYTPRPPYVFLENNKVQGLFATPAEKVFNKAKIKFIWTQTPINRQLTILKENKGLDCTIGYFKNTERAVFANFTNPIYRSKPMAVLANLDINIDKNTTFKKLLTNSKNIILLKENYSYGEDIDKLLADHRPNTYVTAAEASQMVQMIKMRSHYFMIASQEEIDYYLEQKEFIKKGEVQVVKFKDVPQGLYRHIMCSKAVNEKIINRLNKVI